MGAARAWILQDLKAWRRAVFYPKWDKKPFKKRFIWWLWGAHAGPGGEKRRRETRQRQLDWSGGGEVRSSWVWVFWRLSVQDCSGVGYRRGRIEGRFGVELGEDWGLP